MVSNQVLIVDDDADILKLIRRYCEKLGCSVREAQTAAEARAALQGFTPDLVCLDLMLPDGSGYSICEQIRADPRLAQVPVLVLSARSSPVDQAAALAIVRRHRGTAAGRRASSELIQLAPRPVSTAGTVRKIRLRSRPSVQ